MVAFRTSFETTAETTLCWYLQGNHFLQGFLNGGAELDFATIHSRVVPFWHSGAPKLPWHLRHTC